MIYSCTVRLDITLYGWVVRFPLNAHVIHTLYAKPSVILFPPLLILVDPLYLFHLFHVPLADYPLKLLIALSTHTYPACFLESFEHTVNYLIHLIA